MCSKILGFFLSTTKLRFLDKSTAKPITLYDSVDALLFFFFVMPIVGASYAENMTQCAESLLLLSALSSFLWIIKTMRNSREDREIIVNKMVTCFQLLIISVAIVSFGLIGVLCFI